MLGMNAIIIKSTLTLEEARKLPPKDLKARYSLSPAESYNLKSAMVERNFSVLSDPRLNSETMGEKLGYSESTVHNYRNVLIKAGFVKRRERNSNSH